MSTDVLSDLVGWPVMHLFFRIDRARWSGFSTDVRRSAIDEFTAWLHGVCTEKGLQFQPLAGVTKSDVAFMAVHPDVRRIQHLAQELAATALGSCLLPVYSFLSLSDASEYMSTTADHAKHLIENQKLDPAAPEFAASLVSFNKRMAAYAEARVHPQLPTDLPVLCFYPMSKARGETHNWYTLPFEERKKLMGGHAAAGRRHAGRVTQLITSCTGLDNWEWGVTLWAKDLGGIRDAVYEMRFDPASAIYGQFGEFYIALRVAPEDLALALRL